MYPRFNEYIRQHKLLKDNQRVLLAVSGGVDSVVMTELFNQSPFPFGIAHCNFQLRGSESDKDVALVHALAKKLNVDVFIERFNTRAFAGENNISIQMAARTLRYEWLEQIRTRQGYDMTATAHHLDDSIETLLINLVRGSGISGLKGIPIKTKQVIRPLLFATRWEIEAFANEKGLQYREDRSNKERTYQRNQLRHTVIPVLRNINPGLHDSMQSFFERLKGTEVIYQMMIDQQRKRCLERHQEELHIRTKVLEALPYPQIFLYEFLKEYGFSASVCREMISGSDRQPGKRFYSETHTALRDRDRFIVFPGIEESDDIHVEVMPDTRTACAGKHRFRFVTGNMADGPPLPGGPHAVMADADKISFPLVLRTWEPGDTLTPLGMKGKKKVSDLLTGVKIPLHKKKEVLVLTSGDRIVWVVGVRASEDFKITEKTRRYFLATSVL